jgi:four helix bundle protein
VSGSYKDLRAWKESVALALQIYRSTQKFPKDEMYGLARQLRRAAISVPNNMAEGKGRSSDNELVLFLHHARGSLLEAETQLLIARELRYLGVREAEMLLGQVEDLAKMLDALINAPRKAKAA